MNSSLPSSTYSPSLLHRLGRHPVALLALPACLGLILVCLYSPDSIIAQDSNGEVAYEKRWEEREFKVVASTCFNCHETLARALGRPAREHVTSAHFRASVSCHECHGGDNATDDEAKAHDEAKGFVGKPEGEIILDRCATCHKLEVETFRASKHYPEHEGVRRVNCTECHGAHDIGAGARRVGFTWSATCNDCHSLENVTDLPEDLVAMMTDKDQLNEKMRELRTKLNNQPFPPIVMEPLREIRQLSGDIVHATRAQGIGEELTTIVAKSAALTEAIDAELKK